MLHKRGILFDIALHLDIGIVMDKDHENCDEIFNLLEKNEGWASVNRNNVDALITIALERNNNNLERKLRDWK